MTKSNSGGGAALERRQGLGVVLGVPGADDDHGVPGLQLVLLRDERRRRRVERGHHDVDVLGEGVDDLAGVPHHGGAVVERPEQQAELDHRPDLVQRELELGDDAEVAAAAADRPEQVRVLGLGGGPRLAVGGDHARRDQVVDGEPADPG